MTGINSKSWAKIQLLFEQAVDLSPEAREDFLNSQTGLDQRIEKEVRDLLNVVPVSSNFLEPGSFVVGLIDGLAEALEYAQSPVPGSDDDSGGRGRIEFVEQLRKDVQAEFDHYEFLEVLGQGGQGVVFRARDINLDRSVAVKVLRGKAATSENMSLENESRANAKVAHENIVTVFGIEHRHQSTIMISELVRGSSLYLLIRDQHHLKPDVAADVAQQIARGLAAAHENGLVHRDIKPGNLLLESNPRFRSGWLVKIADFGLANSRIENLISESKSLSKEPPFNELFRAGQASSESEEFSEESVGSKLNVAGSLPYLAPELLNGSAQASASTDIYATGVVLYQMLAGRRPFSGSPIAIISQILAGDPIPLRRLDPTIPADLESICLKTISLDPNNRYQTALQLADDLGRFLNGEPTLASPISSFEIFRRWSRRNWQLATSLIVSGMLLILIAGAASSVAWWMGQKNSELVAARDVNAQKTVQHMIDADHNALSFALEVLPDDSQDIEQYLAQVVADEESQPRQRFNATLALYSLGNSSIQEVLSRIDDVPTSQGVLQGIIDAVGDNTAESVRAINIELLRTKDIQKKSKLAILSWFLGNEEPLGKLAEVKGDPAPRTDLIFRLQVWRLPIEETLSRIESTSDPSIQSVMMSGIGRLGPDVLTPHERDAIRETCLRLATKRRAPGLLAVCDWIGRRMGFEIGNFETVSKVGSGNWLGKSRIKLDDDLTMVRVPAGRQRAGVLTAGAPREANLPHDIVFSKHFWLADREISVRLYREFAQDVGLDLGEEGDWQPDTTTSPSDLHPAQRISWFDAVRFCNWLSVRYGREPCYQKSDAKLKAKGFDGNDLEIEIWNCDFNKNGFHLPTEAQFEYAARAGSEAEYWFGNGNELLNELAAFSNLKMQQSSICGSFMPNPFGIFDLHGNVWEWCHDWHSFLGEQELVDFTGPETPLPNSMARTFRGGGVASVSGEPTSHARGNALPIVRFENLGFRVACSASDDSDE